MSNSPFLNGSAVAASTTAWGDARPLDVVLCDIAASTTASVVELSIGAFPVLNPDEVLDVHRDRFCFIGHHSMPVGDGVMLRPVVGGEKSIVSACRRFGLSSFSGHPPNRKHVDTKGFYRWAESYFEALQSVGVGFAVETMYVPQVRSEAVKTGGYHLASFEEVVTFGEWAEGIGWERPLLVDVSHLHIGYRSGLWTRQNIADILESGWVSEIHLSENDGKTDSHRPLSAEHVIHGWVAAADISHVPLVVDEGRRRKLRSRYAGTSVVH